MTIEEFKSLLTENNAEIDCADFEIIHTVYQFHPLAKTKQDIAKLFELGGMTLINDMFPRAKAIGNAEKEMIAAKIKYEEALEHLNSLKA